MQCCPTAQPQYRSAWGGHGALGYGVAVGVERLLDRTWADERPNSCGEGKCAVVPDGRKIRSDVVLLKQFDVVLGLRIVGAGYRRDGDALFLELADDFVIV